MNEIEELEIELKDLENAQNDLVSAMNNMSEIEGLDEEYKNLNLILEAIEERMSEIKIELDNLQEEAYYKENEEQWKAEKREQDYQFERSKF